MTHAEQIFDYRFPSVDYPIVTVSRRLAELAASHGWTVETWDEDGLGEASGVILRLASGRTIFLLELRHLIEHHREKGPTVYIDGSELALRGVAVLLAEILTTLGLTQQDAEWFAPAESQQASIDMLKILPPLLPPPHGPPDSYIRLNNPPDAKSEIECYGELDRDRIPLRWIKQYRDGRLQICSYTHRSWPVVMPKGAISSVAEINATSGFSAREISAAEFEAVWRKAQGFK
ncbi:hypothetical protein SSBR45G_23100 [Bradyrhizobium sp. SSBR45G]|uniref:DUF6881 domain-containing protein n=1 Tax=unclassified Bradyrhizobium TaxID=2631580 RepID=UPI002342B2D1|nr:MULTISPECIES: hypothetical protein [unclassified Bradyrhizobium]GLH77402.1 hypothetical protein SSBR45G_23100 [Bradyrhizobium sp. SSBR45G]GLH84492.1 hypothetical protein SSBR45R_19520 [Bradyrhizobium sp. SSBR45R]